MKEQEKQFDKRVGQQVRTERTMRGMSQENLGDAIGVTFQQIQKYEKGMNRISLSKLSFICAALNMSMVLFIQKCDVPMLVPDEKFVDNKVLLKAVREFSELTPEMQTKICGLMRAINGGGNDEA